MAVRLICASVFFSVILNGGNAFLGCSVLLPLVTVAALLVVKKMKAMVLNLVLNIFVFLVFNSAITTVTDVQVGLHEAEKLIIFVLVCLFASANKEKEPLLKAIGYTAFSAALVGIICYTGAFDLKDFVFQDLTLNWVVRIQSFFKYANTAACYLGIGYLSLFYIYFKSQKKKYLFFMAVVNLAFYLTVSKGAAIVFLFTCAIMLLFKNKYRSHLFLQNAFSAICAATAVVLRSKIPLLLFAIIAIHIYLSMCFVDKIKVKNSHIFAVISVFVVIAAVVLFLYPNLLRTFAWRITYYSDAVKYMSQNFSSKTFLGFGSGSWRVLQFQAQSKDYNISYMHNGILQIFFENGLVATLIFCSVVIRSIVHYIRKKEYILGAMICFVFLHSIIDFNLSFISILIIAGLLCGWSFSECDDKQKNNTKLNGLKLLVPISVITFSVIMSAYTSTELFFRLQVNKEYARKNYEKALQYSQSLEKLCPKDSELQYTISALYERLDNPQAMQEHIKKAVELSQLDPKYYFSYMLVCNDVNVVDACEHLILLAPQNDTIIDNVNSYIKQKYTDGTISYSDYNKIKNNILKTKESK